MVEELEPGERRAEKSSQPPAEEWGQAPTMMWRADGASLGLSHSDSYNGGFVVCVCGNNAPR